MSGQRKTSGRRKTDGMPNVGVRSNVLFHLEPANRSTENLFVDADNSPLQAIDDYGIVVLEIDHTTSVWGSKTLACIEQHRLDVCLYDPSISAFQGFLEIDRDTGVVMLNDISVRSTSRFIRSDATEFPPKSPRRMVILPHVNTQTQLGHEKASASILFGMTDIPKWTKLDVIGAGGFRMKSIKREVKALSKIHLPRIVEFYGSSGRDTGSIKVFMGLRDGSLAVLLKKYPRTPRIDLARRVLRQMLEALACVASHNMIHRDVKPGNILYSLGSSLESPDFFLCDFGQACKGGVDKECGGTRLFRPPEIFQRRPNTPKVDIWALFVTMLEILDEKDWRRRSMKCDASAYS
ncbi:unnamed protein product [Clonostachys rosea]|uniref:mitogen-activated protein kinase n=1 Tax=Bionectria ochroleuca TaxID=29856 RepID=A0ABY6U636_BIOOC|nr:unnamed protein product [Clonostachys rosea]